ncbi:hypothetical protein JL721_13125 [Aureococcus anophagefferens]|nr:hypothetical protein JL721_13125 [Aureococcus anophagefferens]
MGVLEEEHAGFQSTLADLRRLFTKRRAAAEGLDAAVRGREASDAEAVREGARVIELEARVEALEAAVASAQERGAGAMSRAEAAEAELAGITARRPAPADGDRGRRGAATGERLKKETSGSRASCASSRRRRRRRRRKDGPQRGRGDSARARTPGQAGVPGRRGEGPAPPPPGAQRQRSDDERAASPRSSGRRASRSR